MTDPADEKKDRYVGLKVESWKHTALKEVAHRRRSDVSALLRDEIDGILGNYDVDELLAARDYERSDQQELEA